MKCPKNSVGKCMEAWKDMAWHVCEKVNVQTGERVPSWLGE